MWPGSMKPPGRSRDAGLLDCGGQPRGVVSAPSQRQGTPPDLARSDPHTHAPPVDPAANRPGDGTAHPMLAETERIAASLEPELRRVIDMTMERVAQIEQETMRGAREQMAASQQNSQEVIDRSSRLGNSAEILTGTVNEMTSALRAEVDEVTD